MFRLLLLFLSILGVSINFKSIIHKENKFSSTMLLSSTSDLQNVFNNLLPLLLIPAYRFIVFPLLRNRIPSLIKRAGAGLVIMLIGNLLNLTVDTIEHLHSNNTQCMFSDTSQGSANSISIILYWPIIPATVIGIWTSTCSVLITRIHYGSES